MDMETDVLVVGTGVAGMYAALHIRKDLRVVMLTKSTHFECNSYLAQGGITTLTDSGDLESFVEDTAKAGRYKNNEKMVRILGKESIENINELKKFNVPFDMQGDKLLYTREGGHSKNRIVHCKDVTGKKVTETLYEHILSSSNIKVLENTCAVDLLCEGNSCKGAETFKDGERLNIFAKETILACGGIGGLFKNSTNQRTMTGDGLAFALKNKIRLKDVEYIQIHPTALYENKKNEKRFLISESVRGEGGTLKNIHGERFINELLPRDVVAEAIFNEEKKTESPYVILDINKFSKDFIVNRFPGIYNGCLERGVDILKGSIKVTPVQHYFMGGIDVDEDSKTSMDNLYACGETSCTGVHGANRLASNSLLEALVFSRRAANKINNEIDRTALSRPYIKSSLTENEKENNIKLVLDEIRRNSEDKNYELIDG